MSGQDNTIAAAMGSLRVGAFSIFTSIVLLLTLALGGGTRPGLLSDVVSQVVAIPLLVWGALRVLQVGPGKRSIWPLVLVALPIVLPLFQLIAFPLALGQTSAGLQLRRDVLAVVEGSTGSLSVAADVTVLSLLSLLPAVAIFLATLTLSAQERRVLVLVVIAFALVSVVFGLMQLSQGPASALRFYEITNIEDAVGFFANRNHFSAFLNCALVFTSVGFLFAASEAGLGSLSGTWRQVWLIAGFTLIVSLVAAQAMTRSRAGVGIALVALALIGAMMPGLLRVKDARSNPIRALAMAIGLGFVLAIQYGAFRLIERFDVDPLKDARRGFAENTYDAIVAFLPFGSGLGTFTQVYPAFERLDTVLVSTYVNRAHNDLVEYVLEGGVLAAAILGIGVVAFLKGVLPLWFGGKTMTIDLMLQRAAACVLVLILLHSIVDYPLRTASMLSVMALAAALLLSKGSAPSPLVESARREGKKKRGMSQAPQAVSARSMPADDSIGAASPPRGAWGADMVWPDAWKKEPKEGG